MIGLLGLNLAACSADLSKNNPALKSPPNSLTENKQENSAKADYKKWLNPPESIQSGVRAVIIPHHLLVKSFMDKFYKQLAEKNSYKRIVILAPNHFGYGFNFVQTTDVAAGEGLKNIRIKIDIEQAEKLNKEKAAFLEPKLFEREHGVYTHFPFIEKYFPNAEILPIIIKKATPENNLSILIDKLKMLDDGETLFLTSLDFSHYTGEEMAVLNDLRMMDWLDTDEEKSLLEALEISKSADQSNQSVAVDSPESLYVLVKLMEKGEFNFWARTSSMSMIEGLSPLENTSHIFGYFR